MAKVMIRKSDVEGFYTGMAGEFQIRIQRGEASVPRSIDLVLLGLGTCTISTVAHYLERKNLPREELAIELSAEYDEKQGLYKDFAVVLHLDPQIPEQMRKIVAGIARNCRIHRTLEAKPEVTIVAQAAGTSVS